MNFNNLLFEDDKEEIKYHEAVKDINTALKSKKNALIASLCQRNDYHITDSDFIELSYSLLNSYAMTVWKCRHSVFNSLTIEPLVLKSRLCLVENITRTIIHSKSSNGKKFLPEIINMEYFNTDDVIGLNKRKICEELGITSRTFERNIKFFNEEFARILKDLYNNGDSIIKLVFLAEKEFGIDGQHFLRQKKEFDR